MPPSIVHGEPRPAIRPNLAEHTVSRLDTDKLVWAARLVNLSEHCTQFSCQSRSLCLLSYDKHLSASHHGPVAQISQAMALQLISCYAALVVTLTAQCLLSAAKL